MAEFENRDKPSTQENEYFAREDREHIATLRRHAAGLHDEEKQARKQLHHMKCPSCGLDLHHIERAGYQMDTCVHCHGVWLKVDDLKRIAQVPTGHNGHTLVDAVLNLFRSGDGHP